MNAGVLSLATADRRIPDSLPPDLMSAAELAALLKLHPRTIKRYTMAGILPALRLGRTVRYSQREVCKVLAQPAARRTA